MHAICDPSSIGTIFYNCNIILSHCMCCLHGYTAAPILPPSRATVPKDPCGPWMATCCPAPTQKCEESTQRQDCSALCASDATPTSTVSSRLSRLHEGQLLAIQFRQQVVVAAVQLQHCVLDLRMQRRHLPHAGVGRLQEIQQVSLMGAERSCDQNGCPHPIRSSVHQPPDTVCTCAK